MLHLTKLPSTSSQETVERQKCRQWFLRFDTWLSQLTKRRHPLILCTLSLSLSFFNFGSSFIFFFFFPLSRPSKVSWHFLIETSMSSSNVMLRCQCLNSIASLPLHCANRSQSYDEKGTHILQSGNTSAFTSSFSVFIYRYICTCLCARKRRFYQRALLLSLSVVSLSFFSFFNLINNERKESQYRIRGYIR